MRTARGLGLLVATLGLAVTSSGCSAAPEGDLPLAPHAAPTRADACGDLPALGGDPGIVLGTDWSGEHHAYGDTAVVYACVSAQGGGRVSLVEEGTGIDVRPRAALIDPSGSDVIPFQVTVSTGAWGGLRVQQTLGGGGADLPGPVVAADGDGWHFVPDRT